MATTSRIQVFDTTLRDGEQAPGFSMTAAEKLRLAQQLDRLGVDIIEAGFPISSDGDFEAVRAMAGAVRRPIIAGLARAIPADIDRAWAALSARGAAAHPRLPRHLGHSPRTQAAHHRARSASSRSRPPSRTRAPIATMWSSRRRMRREATSTSCARSPKPRSTPAPPRSTCPTLSATRCRPTSSGCSPRSARAHRQSRRCCRRTATTISAWRSRIRWPRCRPARGRSSAPSTASASAPATRRSKRS